MTKTRTLTPLEPADMIRLRSFGLFTALNAEARTALVAEAELVTLPACAPVPGNGTTERLYLVLDGLIGLLVGVGEDSHCLVDMLGVGQLFGEVSVFDLGGQALQMQAITPVRLVAIPAAAILATQAASVAFRRFLLGHLSGRLRKLIRQIAHLKLMTAPQRLGVYLVGLAGPRTGSATLHLPCERRTLAAMLGMSPESLSRAFQTLARVGVANRSRREVIVDSLDGLRAFTSTDPFQPVPRTGSNGFPGGERPWLRPSGRSQPGVSLPPDEQCPYRREGNGQRTEICPVRLSGHRQSLPAGCPLRPSRRDPPVTLRENVLSCFEHEMVCRCALFGELPLPIVRSLLREATLTSYVPAELIFSRGDPANRFFVVLEGRVKLFVVNTNGQESVIDLVATGATFAEAAMFGPGRMPVNAEAMMHTRLLVIPADALMSRIIDDAEVSLLMLSSLARRQRQLIDQVLDLKVHSPGKRLASMLLDLTTSDDGAEAIRLPMSKAALAGQLGITPESMSRALSRLSRFGVSCHGPDITIADIAKLRRYCANGTAAT